jgi:hypothetical protein
VKNFFKGISFSSISAGALAAVTSFLLSAKIGIAGSVIGVAAGSIVSAVSTQIYKNVLKASGEKIQNAVPFGSNSDEKTSENTATTDGDTDATQVIGKVRHDGDDTTVMTSDQTAVISGSPRVITSGADNGAATRVLTDLGHNAETKPHANAANSTDGKSRTMHHAGENRVMSWLHGKYAPAIIAFVSALVGVGLSAGLILVLTHGKGTDTVVHDVVYEKVTPSPSSSSTDTGGTVSGTPTPSTGSTTGGTGDTGGTANQSTTGGGDKTSGGTSDSTSGTSGSTDSKKNGSTDSGTGTTDGGSSSTDGSDSSGTDSGTGSDSSSSDSASNGSTSGSSTGGSSDSGTGTNSSGDTGTTH